MLLATASQAALERSSSGRMTTWLRTPTRPFSRRQPMKESLADATLMGMLAGLRAAPVAGEAATDLLAAAFFADVFLAEGFLAAIFLAAAPLPAVFLAAALFMAAGADAVTLAERFEALPPALAALAFTAVAAAPAASGAATGAFLPRAAFAPFTTPL